MIKVFAIDPNALCDPAIAQCLEQFGFANGRLVGRVPKDWGRQVRDVYRQRYPDDKRLEVRLERLKKKQAIVKVPLANCDYDSWLSAAASLPAEDVQGIIVGDPNTNWDPRVITERDLHDDNDVWAVFTSQDTARQDRAMATVLHNLLRYSNEINFIDPYFAAEGRHIGFLKECLKHVGIEGRKTPLQVKVSFRYGGDTSGEVDPQQAKRVFSEIVRKADIALRETIRRCSSLEVCLLQWQEQEGGERFHERFVVTNRAGVEFGGGLDAGGDSQTTTVTLLSPDQLEKRREWFSDGSSVFVLLNRRTLD